MKQSDLIGVLNSVKTGQISVDQAVFTLKTAPFEDLGYAKVDHHRGLRQGYPEVIYGAGKTADQIVGIVNAMQAHDSAILITRLDSSTAHTLQTHIDVTYDEQARVGIVGSIPPPDTSGTIVVATGGTSDIPVAEEAALTAEVFGNSVTRLYDVGVAGIHRLLAQSEQIMNASCIIAIAGMEGALASVIGGMADCPVIAVPTSVGYGASFNGIAALLAMLNSCASGVSVVNIDNGFGAGYIASMINHMKGN